MDAEVRQKNRDNVCNRECVGTLIYNERIRQSVGLSKLCDGLMSMGNLSRIKSGTRETDESIIKRLTDRLGMTFEDEGAYMFNNDYAEWQRRWRVIDAIECGRISEAGLLIDKYERMYGRKVVREQFAKVMRIQCITSVESYENMCSSRMQEIVRLYMEALSLTIPVNALKNVRMFVLAIDELNMVLEYQFYRGLEGGDITDIKLLEDILKYLDGTRFSLSAKAKLYPKTVVYMYRMLAYGRSMEVVFRDTDKKLMDMLYKYCERALDMLRENAVRYYLTEILEIRREFLVNRYGGGESDRLLRQTNEWLSAIHSLCCEYDVWEHMTNSCYFYKENSVYNIGTVVRVRRNMLNMTMKDLYGGICSEKTLRNLEHNRAGTHRDIAEDLLAKLGLPAGYQRMGIITSKRSTIELYGKWKRLSREFKYEECREVMNELERQLSPHMINRQFIGLGKAIVAYGLKEMDYRTYIDKLCKILGETMDVDRILSSEDVYLSNNEKRMLFQISAKYKYNGDEERAFKYMEPIYRKMIKCTDVEVQENIKDWNFYMTYTASILGSLERYDESDVISRKGIRSQLIYGDISELHCNIFSIAWNENKKNQNKKAYNDNLYQCMLWSQMCNDSFFEEMYRTRMNYFPIS